MSLPLHQRPEVQHTIARYRRDFWRALRRGPARQTFRVLRRRGRETTTTMPAVPPAVSVTPDGSVTVPAILRPPSYHYRQFRGPWLEEHFYRTWERGAGRGAAYLPVFFDALFFHAQCHAYSPGEFALRYRALWELLDAIAASPRPFFTLLGMYEFPIWEWHLFPRNVVVAAADGHGEVPMPLLKGDRPLVRRDKDIRVSFMGALGGPSNVHNVRAEMTAAFGGVAHFGEGPDWEQIMARSHFSLCPRGQGPTSFRLFEALSATSIPVYLWRESCWLPFADELDWNAFALVVEAGRMHEARDVVLGASTEKIRAMQDRIAAVYDGYFRYDSACARIRRRMDAIEDRATAEALTARRGQGATQVIPTK